MVGISPGVNALGRCQDDGLSHTSRVVRALGHALQADERVDDVSSFNERSSTTLSPVVCSCLFR
jgi:hypothetical protein